LDELDIENVDEAPWRLDDDDTKLSDNYCIYAAKKKGNAKDDYPSFSLMTNVKKADIERYSLSCFSCAFIDKATYNIKQKYQKSKQENNEPEAGGAVGQSVGFSHNSG